MNSSIAHLASSEVLLEYGGKRSATPHAMTQSSGSTTGFVSRPRSQTAFSLLEVMIACGIFFMAIFAILAMVSSVLRNARFLRVVEVDAGMVATQIYKTNKLYEGTESGDFGKLLPDYSWETATSQVETNGLFQVDILVRRRGVQNPVDTMSIWLYAPESPQGGGFGRPTFR
jgi:hypothetical protein